MESEIPTLVASRDDAQLTELSRHLASGARARTLTLVLSASAPEGARAAGRALAAELAAHPEVEWVSSGPPEGAFAAIEALYFPRRLAFASPEQRALAEAPEGALRAAARELRRALAGPEGAWLAQHVAQDPLLSFRSLLRQLEAASRGALQVQGGQWVTEDGAVVLFARTRHSPFDAHAQAPLVAALDLAQARLAASGVGLERSGLHRFAAAAEQTARRDATRISILSLAAVVALFVTLFGSLRTIAVAALQLALSLSTASAVCLVWFGSLHPLTIAFGSTLIGVCVDYPIHLAHHHALAGDPRGPLHSLRSIAPALIVGAATSIAGFAGVATSDFPGLRELGVFGGVGLVAGLAAVFVVAPLLPVKLPPAPAQRRIAAGLARGYAWLCRRRGLCGGTLAGVALAIAVATPQLKLSDDVFSLTVPPRPDWVAEEERVQAQLLASERGRVVAVFGAHDEEALVRLETLLPRLEAARTLGALAGFDSVEPFLRSREAQLVSERTFRGSAGLAERIERAFVAEGFAPGAFAPFAQELGRPAPRPLVARDLLDSPFADAMASLRAELADGVALIVSLRGVRDSAAIERAVAASPGTRLVDQRRFTAELYGRYRAEVIPLLGAGVGLVACVLALRFRSLSRVLAAGLPALLATGFVLAALALLGEPVTILHWFGLLLVICFGEDYGVFLVEARGSLERTAALTSITAASASAVLSFGLLAFSSFPALSALGFTVGLGSTVAFLLSPIAAAALLPAEPT